MMNGCRRPVFSGAFLVGIFALCPYSSAFQGASSGAALQTRYAVSRRDQIIKVNEIGKIEKRVDISKVPGLAEAGITKEFIDRTKACSGVVVFPASGEDGMHWETAFSLESAGQIYTPAHGFFNRNKNGDVTGLRHSLDDCFFFNYVNPKNQIPIVLSEDQKIFLKALDLSSLKIADLIKDGMVVRLATPIPGCVPFKVDKSDQAMNEGDVVLSFGAPTQDIVPKPSGTEPVGQFCMVMRKVYLPGKPTFYYLNCSASAGQSGEVQFCRIPVKTNRVTHYEWRAKSAVVISGKSELDKADFDLSKGSYSGAVGIEANHLRDVLK